jgi:hypothetical protein
MIKGSHNTMSYLPVRQWWLRPFRAWGRCQSRTLRQQWAAGVRCFDLRVKFSADGTAHFGHGLLTYRCTTTPEEVIFGIANKAVVTKQKVAIRIWLEQKPTEARRAQFAAWLAQHGIVARLNAAGVAYRIGHKHTAADIYPDLIGRVVETGKQYDHRWHFLLPPCCWQWEQRRILAAITATGYTGIVSQDFV